MPSAGKISTSAGLPTSPSAAVSVAETRMQRSELDWLIYNERLTYSQLVLSGEIEDYLKGTTLHKLDD